MSELIKVTKNDEIIEVHPDALEDHKRLGWVEVVEPESEAEPAETQEPAEEKPAPKAEKSRRNK